MRFGSSCGGRASSFVGDVAGLRPWHQRQTERWRCEGVLAGGRAMVKRWHGGVGAIAEWWGSYRGKERGGAV